MLKLIVKTEVGEVGEAVRPLYSLGLTVSLGRVDFLASLFYLLKDGVVVERIFGCDGSGLCVERNVKRLDA